MNDFEVIQELGSGAFGVVYKAKRKADGNIYAIKRVKISKMNTKDRENALNEVRVLASLSHPNVVDYKEAFYDEESMTLNIVMEFADEGDLANKIKSAKNLKTFITEAEIWSCFIQIIAGLKSLHDKKIMHRDLKSANVFMTKKGEVKLGDLNVSKVVKMGFLHTQTGTPYYASPEVWSEKPYDYKSDLWSVGCIVYEMCAQKPPFRAQSLEMLYKTVIKGVFEPIPNVYSKELHLMVASLLQTDPKKRPSCDGILAMPIIRKKLETVNLNLSVCHGILLNTMKWSTNPLEINQKLTHLKRYNFKLDTNSKISTFNKSNTSKLNQSSDNYISSNAGKFGKGSKNNLNSSTTSDSSYSSNSKEFKMKSSTRKDFSTSKSNKYKSPLVIRKYINLISNERENNNLNSVKKAKNILDVITRSSTSKLNGNNNNGLRSVTPTPINKTKIIRKNNKTLFLATESSKNKNKTPNTTVRLDSATNILPSKKAPLFHCKLKPSGAGHEMKILSNIFNGQTNKRSSVKTSN